MSLFLLLFAACIVGGFLATSLIWVIFWTVGVFAAPEGVRNFLGIRPRVQQHQNVFIMEWRTQVASGRAFAFRRTQDPVFGPMCANRNSASQPFLRTEISPDRNNTAHAHGLAAN